MSDTNFTNAVTLTDAGWFNDVNDALYNGQGLSGKSTVASATSPDIFAVSTSHVIEYTGTTTCTGFTTAPAAGTRRILICTGAAPFTAGANLLINGVASGTTITVTAGTIVEVMAFTTTQFYLRVIPMYAEGSWTPTLVGTGGGPLTYTTQVGRYIRNGNKVEIWALVQISGGVGITGNVSMGGLPFTSSTITNYIASLAVGNWELTLSANYTQISAIIQSNSSSIDIFQNGSGQSSASIPAASIGAGSFIEVSGSYRIN